eukprot:TRINITY_DN8145_c0_g1_i1.p1 TRINITY_DN8145_c0_g1~~TRINITY_DN8145_c0_g1_i1.p1  ORF type:complete len:964 (+),score=234.57 TRINITY_DN8145_c0_g1_i1:70-2892(+)
MRGREAAQAGAPRLTVGALGPGGQVAAGATLQVLRIASTSRSGGAEGYYLEVSDSAHRLHIGLAAPLHEAVADERIRIGQLFVLDALDDDAGAQWPVISKLTPLPHRYERIGDPQAVDHPDAGQCAKAPPLPAAACTPQDPAEQGAPARGSPPRGRWAAPPGAPAALPDAGQQGRPRSASRGRRCVPKAAAAAHPREDSGQCGGARRGSGAGIAPADGGRRATPLRTRKPAPAAPAPTAAAAPAAAAAPEQQRSSSSLHRAPAAASIPATVAALRSGPPPSPPLQQRVRRNSASAAAPASAPRGRPQGPAGRRPTPARDGRLGKSEPRADPPGAAARRLRRSASAAAAVRQVDTSGAGLVPVAADAPSQFRPPPQLQQQRRRPPSAGGGADTRPRSPGAAEPQQGEAAPTHGQSVPAPSIPVGRELEWADCAGDVDGDEGPASGDIDDVVFTPTAAPAAAPAAPVEHADAVAPPAAGAAGSACSSAPPRSPSPSPARPERSSQPSPPAPEKTAQRTQIARSSPPKGSAAPSDGSSWRGDGAFGPAGCRPQQHEDGEAAAGSLARVLDAMATPPPAALQVDAPPPALRGGLGIPQHPWSAEAARRRPGRHADPASRSATPPARLDLRSPSPRKGPPPAPPPPQLQQQQQCHPAPGPDPKRSSAGHGLRQLPALPDLSRAAALPSTPMVHRQPQGSAGAAAAAAGAAAVVGAAACGEPSAAAAAPSPHLESPRQRRQLTVTSDAAAEDGAGGPTPGAARQWGAGVVLWGSSEAARLQRELDAVAARLQQARTVRRMAQEFQDLVERSVDRNVLLVLDQFLAWHKRFHSHRERNRAQPAAQRGGAEGALTRLGDECAEWFIAYASRALSDFTLLERHLALVLQSGALSDASRLSVLWQRLQWWLDGVRSSAIGSGAAAVELRRLCNACTEWTKRRENVACSAP